MAAALLPDSDSFHPVIPACIKVFKDTKHVEMNFG